MISWKEIWRHLLELLHNYLFGDGPCVKICSHGPHFSAIILGWLSLLKRNCKDDQIRKEFGERKKEFQRQFLLLSFCQPIGLSINLFTFWWCHANWTQIHMPPTPGILMAMRELTYKEAANTQWYLDAGRCNVHRGSHHPVARRGSSLSLFLFICKISLTVNSI